MPEMVAMVTILERAARHPHIVNHARRQLEHAVDTQNLRFESRYVAKGETWYYDEHDEPVPAPWSLLDVWAFGTPEED